MAEKKVLILSCNTGGGHNAAGRAIFEELCRRGCSCAFADYLGLASRRISRNISQGYVDMVTKVPRLFGIIYKAGGLISSKYIKSPVYFANVLNKDNLRRFIQENGFNVAVMPHLFPAEALTALNRRGDMNVRSVVISTDYTCIPFWEETKPDVFILPHRELEQEYCRAGIPPERLLPLGIPVSEQFNKRTDKKTARVKLGLNPERPCVLIMSGSMGFGDASSLISGLISRYGDGVSAVLLGGGNQQLKSRVRSEFAGRDNVTVVDFTPLVGLYMDAADVLLTKPGGLTTTEFAVKNVPAILTRPIPGCETKNAEFFTSHGMAASCKSVADQLEVIDLLLSNRAAREKMMRAQRENINRFAARDICDYILRD